MNSILRVGCLSPLLAVVASCGGGGTESVTKFDGVEVTVRLPHGRVMHSEGRDADGVHTWKSGDLEYVIDHMRLKVDGRDYGLVRAGDRVLITPGRVAVNDQERPPE